ncbi:hypothetical protein GCM10007392_09680 [Saccharospirillum salsuginis]|uniref:DoxX-like family protein n=2 Tax=Saccharospirillum salsuginis TaxID=418750 RepID=A0A918N693_9GAMM|nr:hypothetical protein GCM10007392_09680 [Saccharospirillum salsuginis]
MLARWVLAFIFFYHGLVPKILFTSETEIRMIEAHGLPVDPLWVARAGGVIEILLAIVLLVFSHHRWPLYLVGGMLILLLLDVAFFSTELLFEAFNPVTLNISALALVAVALKESREGQAVMKPQPTMHG